MEDSNKSVNIMDNLKTRFVGPIYSSSQPRRMAIKWFLNNHKSDCTGSDGPRVQLKMGPATFDPSNYIS
ncbi:unnamed protein product [Sphenostylis stenocarpa]|uniref:Uncharacterized protein n=1 Tax=Sphenostylis stenocarpa TaxID=92480 RepID=A0AA86SMQ7_9FABA|nr:unnamed protein product [Sphenostylis stenocarpa]